MVHNANDLDMGDGDKNPGDSHGGEIPLLSASMLQITSPHSGLLEQWIRYRGGVGWGVDVYLEEGLW